MPHDERGGREVVESQRVVSRRENTVVGKRRQRYPIFIHAIPFVASYAYDNMNVN